VVAAVEEVFEEGTHTVTQRAVDLMVREVSADLVEALAQRELVPVEVGEERCGGGDHARLQQRPREQHERREDLGGCLERRGVVGALHDHLRG
jgi:hypothetical protein